jgi:predicted DNA-binding protein
MAQVTLNTRISIETNEKLKLFVDKEKVSIASVVEKAIEKYINESNA